MDEDLLTCPRCRAPAMIEHVPAHSHTPMLQAVMPLLLDAEDQYWPSCTGCGLALPGKASRAEAVAAWNWRKPEPENAVTQAMADEGGNIISSWCECASDDLLAKKVYIAMEQERLAAAGLHQSDTPEA